MTRAKAGAVKEGKEGVKEVFQRATIVDAQTMLQTNASVALEGLDGLHPKEEKGKRRAHRAEEDTED
jgi:hypothetical protein